MIGTVCLGMADWMAFVSPLSQVEVRFWKSGSLGPFVVLLRFGCFPPLSVDFSMIRIYIRCLLIPWRGTPLKEPRGICHRPVSRSKTLGLAGELM